MPTAGAADYRGRFAPSPTGPLHFGSLVAAVASYADARAAGGTWLVRIEDVDLPRVAARRGRHDPLPTGSATDSNGMAPVWRQSERAGVYREALGGLQRGGTCLSLCSARGVTSQPNPTGPIGERVYRGTCRGVLADARAASRRDAIRVRVPAADVAFVDRLYGPQRQCLASDVGDFIIRRGDGLAAYQLAVVVDDAAQRITDVVRGADLLASTPRQIFLQQALGLPTPRYLHVPVALDAQGRKLSKQTGARALREDPLAALLSAWRFLEQPEPSADIASAREFWVWARAQWTPARLPPASMLPAPVSYGGL